MDTLTFDIIANSGPEPDRTYASQILPLRRQGHQTLCTLIVANMLMNVLVVQEVGVILETMHELNTLGAMTSVVSDNDALGGFIISILIIIIFTEILPMSICKSKYSLRIAAAGSGLVRVAMILAYPVTMPMGKLLDRFVPHDAGQIYDRNELRKLMILHCEAHGDRSGLVKSELQLLIAAMDFHEKKVSDIITPIEKTTTVQANEVITAEVIERLWNSGRSRIPVEQSPNNYTGVLLVKDLLTVSLTNTGTAPPTIGDLVQAKSRPFATVGVNAPLPTILKFFQHAKTHMLLVFTGDEAAHENNKNDENELRMYSFYRRSLSLDEGCKIVGVVTLEDVVEELIKEEIYDEYDRYGSCVFEYVDNPHISVPLKGSGIPMPLPEPTQVPRANFYSYGVHAYANVHLTEAQVWAVAYYLTRAVKAFFLWNPGYVKMLLDACGDQQLIPPPDTAASTPHKQNARERRSSSSRLLSPNAAECSGLFRTPSTSWMEAPQERHNPDLISRAAEERFVLYRDGEPSTTFTLVLGGKVDMLVGPNNFPLKRRSFEWLAEEALTSPYYVPDFDAVVLSPTRVYRIRKDQYEQYLVYNSVYMRAYEGGELTSKKHTDTVHRPISRVSSAQPVGTAAVHTSRMGDKDTLLVSPRSRKLYGTFGDDVKLP
ncbi:putative receptor-type adenylate cyclase GRESAG 4 [Trypanosoma grayi]|uniref:putative receptor-type adenylate cyclase GRESAG 4 n=1 Tax=Trypanosoma grayi TaxID=71804 RepID=UPI0004F49542|nr:putative receptor-type adenylate cyclase GRESAG 4 [Trypanosoma grayi]KEG12157.1 putative receptor-type adenylate cyclase GRESAG 4 [Trypanosoma grayi]